MAEKAVTLGGNKVKGKVESLNISPKKGTKKFEVEEVVVEVDHGIVGDAHAGNWHRQISLLSLDSINKMIELGVPDLQFGSFAENISMSGFELFTLPIGTQFKFKEVVLELTQIGKKCHSGCEITRQVGQCIMPKEGIFAKVIKAGKIKKGETIEVILK